MHAACRGFHNNSTQMAACSMSKAEGLTGMSTKSATAMPGSINPGRRRVDEHPFPAFADEEFDCFGSCICLEQLGVLCARAACPPARQAFLGIEVEQRHALALLGRARRSRCGTRGPDMPLKNTLAAWCGPLSVSGLVARVLSRAPALTYRAERYHRAACREPLPQSISRASNTPIGHHLVVVVDADLIRAITPRRQFIGRVGGSTLELIDG